MFERFTEKARRVIFYARYEASQYGSTYIDTEHLLLGLVRQDRDFIWRFLACGAFDIRKEIEKVITVGTRVSTAVEVPLTQHAKNVLTIAMDESDRLGHRHVGCEHLLVGLLTLEGSVAARILTTKGVKLEAVRDQVARPSGTAALLPRPSSFALQVLDGFLSTLKEADIADIRRFLAKNVQIVDCRGKLWHGIEDLGEQAEVFFTPYAKKDVRFAVESSARGPGESVVANILWENVSIGKDAWRATHRMTVLLGAEQPGDWLIFALQVTPVAFP